MADSSSYAYDVFIAYAEADKAWVLKELLPRVEKAGVKVCIFPRDKQVGAPKVDDRERAITSSHRTLLVLTDAFLKDEWSTFAGSLIQTLDVAAKDRRVVPLLKEKCTVPPHINYLTPADFTEPDEMEIAWRQIVAALTAPFNDIQNTTTQSFQQLPDEAELTPFRNDLDDSSGFDRFRVDLLTNIDPPDGALDPHSVIYIERPEEKQWLKILVAQGKTVRIKGASHTGKSSLLARMHEYSINQGKWVLYIGFQNFDKSVFQSLETLLRYIAVQIESVRCNGNAPDIDWNSPLGSKDKLSNYLYTAILSPAKDSPLILMLDDVDRVFDYDYRDDFFSLIRAWHDKRAIDRLWRKLNIVLAYSTEAHLFIKNLNQSPFNVGMEIVLTDFDRSQLLELNRRHQNLLNRDEISELMDLIGGHPYLWRRALYMILYNQITFRDLITTASDDDGPYSSHLHQCVSELHDLISLKLTIRAILERQGCESHDDFRKLLAAGIISGHNKNQVRFRYKLYERFFRGWL